VKNSDFNFVPPVSSDEANLKFWGEEKEEEEES